MAPNSKPKSSSSSISLSQFHSNCKPNSLIIDDDDFQDSSSIPKKPKKQLNGKENQPPPDLNSSLNQQPIQVYNNNYNIATTQELELEDDGFIDDEGNTQLNILLNLCTSEDDKCFDSITCPLCGADLSEFTDDLRHSHTNQCLDKMQDDSVPIDYAGVMDSGSGLGQVVDGSPVEKEKEVVVGGGVSRVLAWIRELGLEKYEEVFVREEIDWDALQWLTEEDLSSIGITALGPRKKIVNALRELRNASTRNVEEENVQGELRNELTRNVEESVRVSRSVARDTKQLGANKLITDFFLGPVSARKKEPVVSTGMNNANRRDADSTRKSVQGKGGFKNRKQKDVPLWCCIPGTPFRVDAFKYLRRDCSHWFLTHFHLDHYQGLTKSFCHGMIYCSSITAKLINIKIGIPCDKIHILPLNETINIEGTKVTCFDANHCPGAVIILFEPPNAKPVLHTGDFRFSEEMAKLSIFQAPKIHTLILDTTYCDPQYDFPKQEAVIQFVIDAVQAEEFNPKTLFLIGSYTIGKERLFIELARVLRKKIYVTAAKLRLMECLGLQQEDMQWFTPNELESHIHVVPMWSIASFKRLKHVSNQYMKRYSLIVAFSPTGWTFGKGKKATGRRWQQGTIIRYEVPYSEHSSFTELREFVKLISPAEIIPSVNNDGPDSQQSLVSQLLA